MQEGTVLSGRYRLDAKRGCGAMGVVWQAFDLRLEREVAVKTLPDLLSDEPRKVERFLSEAKIGAALQHPGIVAVFDVDEHQGQRFFVMELLTGEDLSKLLWRHRNGLPITTATRIAERVADALAAAHTRNVIHRDVKPANIMVLTNGRTKLCDFGVARMVRSSENRGTSGIGTVDYMAPEQFEGRLDERADLYALGCVLYESLTGQRPFLGTSAVELMFMHTTVPPTPPSSLRGDVPHELEKLVLELMAKDPADRPQKAAEVAARLKSMRLGPALKRTEDSELPITTKVEERRPDPVKTKPLYQRPPMRLLRSGSPGRRRTDADEAVAKAIGDVLAKAGADARVTEYNHGPSCARYEVRLGPMARPSEIIALKPRIIEAIMKSDVRVVPMGRSSSPLPDVEAVAVEVPNTKVDVISVGDVLRDLPMAEATPPLTTALGRDADGKPVTVDLVRAPHMLIGGSARGSAVEPLRAIVTSVLMRADRDEVRMLLIDEQTHSLAPFEGVPHLVEPIVTTPRAAEESLRWALAELERRYDDMAAAGCRTVHQYNYGVFAGRIPAPMHAMGDIALPHPPILLVVGEVAELSLAKVGPVEAHLARLTQLGRAAGIHVVLRTTRLDERVLAPRAKAHVPTRLALPVSSAEASIRLLDREGAESLHAGEALLRPGGGDAPNLLHLAQITQEEIRAVVDHCRSQG